MSSSKVWMICRVCLLAGILLHIGESVPRDRPPAWNFLLKKEPLPTMPAPRPEKGDSLRIPPVDFLLKRPSHLAQDKHSPTRYDDSDEYNSYDSSSREHDYYKRPRQNIAKITTPEKPQPWLKSTLSTSKLAITNYIKAVKKMFKDPSQPDNDANLRHVQERGDQDGRYGTGSELMNLKAKKYGTNVAIDGKNRVKSVAVVIPPGGGPNGGDPFTETSYLRDDNAGGSEEGLNLGIGEAISDLFWGSVYGGTK